MFDSNCSTYERRNWHITIFNYLKPTTISLNSTITVTLTPFGRPDKSLYVKDIDKDKITISSDHLTNVKCFYEVWVARYINPENHDEKLHVVYEGESPADYPDNNDNFIIGGYQ